jgi:hypothetical protein
MMSERDLSPWLALLRDECADLFDPTTGDPSPVALSIAESCETFRDMDAADNWLSILTTGARIAANARTLEREHGSVNATRAAVDKLMREYDRDPSPVARAVDPWDGQRHTYTTGRNKKGATTYRQNMSGKVVMHYGVAPVQGSCEAPDPDDVRAAMASHLLGYVRSLALGLNSLNVCQVTNAIYGAELDPCAIGLRRDGSERYAPMIGTDYATKAQVFDPAHEACREPIWEHNLFGPVVMARTGAEYTYGAEHGPDYGPRRPVVTWLATANGSHYASTRRTATFRDYPLPRVSVRKSERERVTQRRVMCIMRKDGVTRDLSTYTRALLAPADHDHVYGADTERGFFGHVLMTRGSKARKATGADRARAARSATVRKLPEMTLSSQASAETLLTELEPGDRLRVRVNSTFVLTVSRRVGKFNMHLSHGAPVGQTGHVVWRGGLQVRSATTAARRIMHALNT